MGCGGGGGVAALRESETEKRAEGKKEWERLKEENDTGGASGRKNRSRSFL